MLHQGRVVGDRAADLAVRPAQDVGGEGLWRLNRPEGVAGDGAHDAAVLIDNLDSVLDRHRGHGGAGLLRRLQARPHHFLRYAGPGTVLHEDPFDVWQVGQAVADRVLTPVSSGADGNDLVARHVFHQAARLLQRCGRHNEGDLVDFRAGLKRAERVAD